MAHTYQHTLDEWATNGTKSAPSSTLKSTGFTGGMKPPASVFNYQWDKIAKAIAELQQYALTEDPSGGIWQQLAAVALSGSYNDLLNKPDFKAVATSGSYTDLINVPSYLANYSNYWWRIRQNAGSYSLRLVPATQMPDTYESATASNGTKYQKVNILETWSRNNGNDNDGEYEDPRTIQIASSISVSSNGTISLSNPSSYAISGEDFYSLRSTYESRLAGKYVKGFAVSPNTIYKMPSSPDIQTWNASITVSGENTRYFDYYLHASTVQVAAADYAATIGDYTYVSNEDENFYPHTGTQNGVEYQYLGTISDIATKNAAYDGVRHISITSASWNSKTVTVTIPVKRCLIWIGQIPTSYVNLGDTYPGLFGLFTDNKIYATMPSSSNYGGRIMYIDGSKKIYIWNNIYVYGLSNGVITIGTGDTTGGTFDVYYLPI